MLRFTCATIIATAALAAIAPAARADITVFENDKTIDVDCVKDANISLLGNHITVNAKGVCGRIAISGNEATVNASASAVSVTGNKNTINLDAADEVSITGNDNTVTVHKPLKAKTTRISNPGNRNKISRPR